MDNLLSFLSGKLKHSGMTVDELCKKLEISRQKFYRFVKEPHRFSNENVRMLISALSLSQAEINQLESYLNPYEHHEASLNLTEYGPMIESLFRHKLSMELTSELDIIEYTQADRQVTMESAATLARIMAGFDASPAGSEPFKTPEHEYEFTLYNCIPSRGILQNRKGRNPAKYIQLLAGIINELEDALSPVSSVRIRIRHYTPETDSGLTGEHESNDKDLMHYHIHLLDTLLPLLSTAEDYSIRSAQGLKNSWMAENDLCLVRHTSHTTLERASSAAHTSFSTEHGVRTEYYLLAFTGSGECRACRLGSEEAVHIYRFLSADGRGTRGPDKMIIDDPNLYFYEMDKDEHKIMFHQDLSFAYIPSSIWMTMLRNLSQREDIELFDKAIRSLIDPNGKYAFLKFEDLVQAAIQTLSQRAEADARMGTIMICHPDGLLNLVRTGMIMDMSVGPNDYTGKSWSSNPLRFSKPMIRELLESIKSSVLRRQAGAHKDTGKSERINYYLLHPQFPLPEISFIIYDERGVCPLYSKGRHKHTITNIYENSALGTLLFNYVKNEMIGKRGTTLGSDILSDEHSIVLLDNLITMLEEE